MQNAADHPAVVDAILAANVRRQMRFDLLPLFVAQPEQIGPHPLLHCESSQQANQQPIQTTMTFLGFGPRCYRAYLGLPEQPDDDASSFLLSGYVPTAFGDLPQLGEMTEVSAFELLRRGEIDRAQGCFDSAATYFYLAGLRNAGRLNEWASHNAPSLVATAQRRMMTFPDV
jgi:hypothetical protein